MTTFTTEDREASEPLPITCLSKEMRTKFEKQFPDLIENHIAWMCWREGWQRGAESAYNEVLGDGHEYS